MELIKITEDHYIVVDENIDINENDYTFKDGEILEVSYLLQDNGHIITHSTQPLELLSENGLSGMGFSKVKPLNLFEVKELIGEMDVEKKADKMFPNPYVVMEGFDITPAYKDGYVVGYNQALEDNKEKKYTEEDMRIAMDKMSVVSYHKEYGISSKYKERKNYIDNYLQFLQPKTEWEVEFIDGKLKLK